MKRKLDNAPAPNENDMRAWQMLGRLEGQPTRVVMPEEEAESVLTWAKVALDYLDKALAEPEAMAHLLESKNHDIEMMVSTLFAMRSALSRLEGKAR